LVGQGRVCLGFFMAVATDVTIFLLCTRTPLVQLLLLLQVFRKGLSPASPRHVTNADIAKHEQAPYSPATVVAPTTLPWSRLGSPGMQRRRIACQMRMHARPPFAMHVFI